MRALITGGAGFIGSHLGDALLARGDSVIALDNLATGRHDNIREHLADPRFEFVLGSIVNADLVDDLVARADVVFHLAAAVGVKLIVERPLEWVTGGDEGQPEHRDRSDNTDRSEGQCC